LKWGRKPKKKKKTLLARAGHEGPSLLWDERNLGGKVDERSRVLTELGRGTQKVAAYQPGETIW